MLLALSMGAALAQEPSEAETACRGGAFDQCVAAAQTWNESLGVQLTHAVEMYRIGCDGGDAIACGYLGMRLWDGYGVGQNLGDALPLLEKGCNQGGAGFACGRYADAIRQGVFGPPDLQLMFSWYDSGCTLGDSHSCAMRLAVASVGGGTDEKLHSGALKSLWKVCAKGKVPTPYFFQSEGCSALAAREHTLVSPIDEAKVLSSLEVACASGSREDCVGLGWWLQTPLETPRDNARALAVYGETCSAGLTQACFQAALMVQEGRGQPADHALAEQLFVKACDDGFPVGCLAAGDLWAHDPTTATFVPMQLAQDDAKAALLYDRACAQGVAASCSQRELLRSTGRVP